MPRIIPITDAADPRIEAFRDVRDRDLRGRDGLFMAESERVLRRLLPSPQRIQSILLTPARLESLGAALEPLPDSIPVFVAPVELISSIAGFHVHRGVLAAGMRPAPQACTPEAALGHLRGRESLRLLIAEGLNNVDNMGGLFRNAAAFGVDGVALDPSCCDPLYRKAIRVSMGHVFGVPWAVCDDWPADLARLKRDWGLTIIAAETTPGATPPWRLPRSPRVALLLGSEREGLSSAAMAQCDAVCRIPMASADASLNVATASAVLLYELGRAEGA